jgi:cyclophilin family peptidyl-prolyl cis-trans isomerase/HEAT repeat protein
VRTAQNTHAGAPRKEPQGTIAVSAVLGLTLLLSLGACRGPAHEVPGPYPFQNAVGIDGEPRELLRIGDAGLRRSVVHRLRDSATEDDVGLLVGLLSDEDVDVAADAALALAVCGVPGAPGRLAAALGPHSRPEVVTAAALGLGSQPGDDAERGLFALARRPERPAAVPGALLSHYRWRGRPAEPQLGEPALLDYADHADAAGRAGFGHYARAVKDPALVAALVRLTTDADAEVRRAATIGLAPSSRNPWPDAEAQSAFAAVAARAEDTDELVVVAACRAMTGFDRTESVVWLQQRLGHDGFPVRVAAVEGLARREAKDAAGAIAELATSDPSVSVRGAAASAVAALDPALGSAIAAEVLSDPAEFVRASGIALLTAVEGEGAETATARLIELAAEDPHVRVRHTALGGLEGREGGDVTEAVRRALAEDGDPVVVAVACGVAAANGLDELLPLVRAVPERFPGRDGGDAREGALGALAAMGHPEDAAILRAHVRDPNPSVAFAAQSGLATMGGFAPSTPERAGVRNAEPLDLNLAVASMDVQLVVETTHGTLRIDLDAGAAPRHVAHVVAFAQRGGYDGLTWHRVVPDFVIQGGCPRGDGAGSAGVSLPLEPTRIPFERGVLGMPRSSHPDSGGCQLFVMHSRAPHLDVHYTAFGRVVDGLDVIDRIDVDDHIVSVRVVRSRGGSR